MKEPRRQHTTLLEWVLQVLRRVRERGRQDSVSRKMDAIRVASGHDFPTADVDQMLAEIGRGYLPRATAAARTP